MLNLIVHLAKSGHQVWFGESDTVTITRINGNGCEVVESAIAPDRDTLMSLLGRYGATLKSVDDNLLLWRDEGGDDWACDRGYLYRAMRGEHGVCWEVKLLHGITIHSPFDASFWFSLPWAARFDVTVNFSLGHTMVVSAPTYINLHGDLDTEQVMAWLKLSGMQNATGITFTH